MAPEISLQVLPELIDFCHWVVNEPVPPEADALLVKAVGSAPKQMVWLPETVPALKELRTVMVTCVVSEQPLLSVPISSYVVVVDGVAVTELAVADESVALGDQA